MADVAVEKLIVEIEARTRQFETQLKKVEATVQGTSRRVSSSFSAIDKSISSASVAVSSFARGLAAGAITAGVAALIGLTKSAVSSTAAIGDLADKLGISAEQVQELQFGAVQAQLSLDELGKSMLFFSRQIGEASRGQGNLVEILEANNIALRDSQGNLRPLGDLLRDYADLVKNAANQQEALVFTVKAFGRANDEMLEFLAKGSGGLDGYAQAARAAGEVIDEQLVRRAQQFDDAWAKAMLAASANFKSFVLTIVDGVADIDTKLDAFGNAGFFTRLGKLLGIDPAETQAKWRAATGQTGNAGGAFPGGSLAARPGATVSVLPNPDDETNAVKANAEAKRAATVWTRELARAEMDWHDEIEAANEALREQTEEIAGAVKNALGGFIEDLRHGVSATEALTSALDRLVSKMLDMALDRVFQSILTGGVPGTGFKFPGFASGGSFTVGGRGGVDSQMVAFRATPGEPVTVGRRAAQQGGNIRIVVNNHSGAPVTTRQQGTGDDRTLEIAIGKIMKRQMTDGEYDSVMRGRFGAGPSVRQR